jgi:hypothetical protein
MRRGVIQQVNLYQLGFEREQSWLSSVGILMITGGVGALLLLLYAHLFVSTWLQGRVVAGLEANKAEQTSRLERLKEHAASQTDDEVLIAEIESLSQEVRAKQRLSEVLSPEAFANTDGFSSHLVALARQRIHGVWLREIRISDGGRSLALTGSTLAPAAVPELLEKLGREPAFSGREFRRFLLERAPQGSQVVDFVVSTHAGTDS